METKKTKEVTYTKEQVMHVVAGVLADVTLMLKDPALVIVGILVTDKIDKKLK